MTPNMSTFPTRYELPVAYSTEIGRIITRFSYIQWQVKTCGYIVMGVDPKVGRMLVREPDLSEHLTLIQEIMKLQGLRTTVKMTVLKHAIQQIESFRNRLAHGVWVKHGKTKTPTLQVTKGTYTQTKGGPKFNARIYPRSDRVTLKNLRDIRVGLGHTKKGLHRLADELAAQHGDPSRRKFLRRLGLAPSKQNLRR